MSVKLNKDLVELHRSSSNFGDFFNKVVRILGGGTLKKSNVESRLKSFDKAFQCKLKGSARNEKAFTIKNRDWLQSYK